MFNRVQRLLSRLAERSADFFAAIVAPFERLFGSLSRGAFDAVDRAEAAGSKLWGVGRAITWPLRIVGRVVAALLPRAIVDWLASIAATFGRAQAAGVHRLLQLAEWLNLDRLVMWLVWLLQPIWRPIAAIGGFVVSWAETRNYRAAAWGLPAIVLGVMVMGISGWHWLQGAATLAPRYKIAVQEALDAQDYDRARLFESKLAQLGVDTQLTEFRTALALADNDQFDEAFRRMQRLASTDQPGYPSAHNWMVHQSLSGKLGDLVDDPHVEAGKHLEHLQTLGIASEHLQLLRALWLAQGNELEAAAEALEPLTTTMPQAAIERMRIDLALRRSDQAQQDARSLVTHMSRLQGRGAEFSATEYQWWLAAEEVLGNLEKMDAILEQWLVLEPDNERPRKALAAVRRRQADQLMRAALPDARMIADYLLDATELEGADRDAASIYQLARALYRDRAHNPIYARVLDELRESPRTSADVLAMLGAEAAIADRFGDARKFLAAAVERDASHAVAWNNLGLVLSDQDGADLDRALEAVNRALEIAPNEHRFRETRGQILIRLERWDEAIADLEFALNGLPELAAIHASLADAYAALGNNDLAELHRGQTK